LVLAEVFQACAVELVVLEDCARRRRQQDLATVARRTDPSGPMDRHPEIPLFADEGLTRVKTHADAHGG
jgi:hypothetical protein